jgi:TIR domain
MPGIAISYRREDTGWITGRIFDRLKDHYERAKTKDDTSRPIVFMDYDSTPIGVDFRKFIKGVLDECDVLLAIIGPRWSGDDGSGNPRILQESDWVRIEIETALANNIPVVPILIDRTPMPSADKLPEGVRELVYRQAAIIDTQIDFNSHVDRLIREIDRLLGIARPREEVPYREAIRFSDSAESLQGVGSVIATRSAYDPRSATSASRQNRSPFVASWVRRISRPGAAYVLVAVLACALAASLWSHLSGQRKFSLEPAYTGYSSPELGVGIIFPNNIFTLDTTERMQRRLVLRDEQGQPTIKVLRTTIPEHRNVKLGRQNEVADRGIAFEKIYCK